MAKQGGGMSVVLKDRERENEPKSRAHSVGRFSLFFAILKGRFGRLMLVNAIALLSAIPLILILLFRYLSLAASDMTGPYGAGLGVGYPMLPHIPGLMEYSVLRSDLFFFALLIPAAAIFALSLAGGMYLCVNMIKTEGVYHFSDLKRGIRQSYLPVLFAVLLFTGILFLTQTVNNIADWQMSIGSPKWAFILSKVIGYLVLAFALMVGLWMISLGIGYKLGPWRLFRNAVVLTVGTLPQTIFFAALFMAPSLLLFFTSGFFFAIGIVFFSLIGFAFAMLLWMSYSQWVIDKYLSPETEEVKKTVTKKEQPEERPLTREELVRVATAYGRSVLITRPIEPLNEKEETYEIPEIYSREDIENVSKCREALLRSAEEYAGAHVEEARYAEFNRKLAERDRALPSDSKKKIKRPKMLKR